LLPAYFLLPKFEKTFTMNLPIENEQEAAVAILFASVLYENRTLKESEIEQLSRMLVLI
jgi:hypothetical protein